MHILEEGIMNISSGRTWMLSMSLAMGSSLFTQAPIAAESNTVISDRVKLLARATPWRQVGTIPVSFNTQHPQGMVKIGDTFYVTAVEIKTPTKRFPQPQGGFDRDTGEGVGHLFKFDAKGNLITDLVLGEGSVYH